MANIRLSFLIALVVLALLGVRPCAAQSPVVAEQSESPLLDVLKSDPAFLAWGRDSEVSQCGICHYSPGNAFASRDTEFCRLEEVRLWLQNDKHAVSRQRVEPLSREEIADLSKDHPVSEFGPWAGESNFVSYEMCRKLGYDLRTAEGYQLFCENCLSCHAGYDPNKPAAAQKIAQRSQAVPGITCNYCHQSDQNDHREWIDQHGGFAAKEKWRLLPPEQKELAGMRDLVDAPAQAKLCAECHIGDHSSRKFVSHAMYVAGHPPLPNFELQTFVSNMPPHWRDIESTDKNLAQYPGREQYFSTNLPVDLSDGTLSAKTQINDFCWETRAILLGALQAAKQTSNLLVEAEHGIWGDFALYDCSACHHELRVPSLRQQRKSGEVPGRPRLLEWQTPLLDVALELVDAGDDVKAARKELHLIINETPFGEANRSPAKARVLAAKLEQATAQLENFRLGPEQAIQVLRLVANTPDDQLLDYHSARQAVWAVQSIERELQSKNYPLPEPVRTVIALLGKGNGEASVFASLPSGRATTLYTAANLNAASPDAVASTDVANSEAADTFLVIELDKLQRYDAAVIQRQFAELRKILGDE